MVVAEEEEDGSGGEGGGGGLNETERTLNDIMIFTKCVLVTSEMSGFYDYIVLLNICQNKSRQKQVSVSLGKRRRRKLTNLRSKQLSSLAAAVLFPFYQIHTLRFITRKWLEPKRISMSGDPASIRLEVSNAFHYVHFLCH